MKGLVNSKDGIKKRRVQTTQLKKNKKDIKKIFNKVNITFLILFIIDIVLVIYLARKNIVNYIIVFDEEIFASETSYLLWGRNYINLIVIGFFYLYMCLVNKFFLKRSNTKRFLIWLFAILLVLNILLFILFTKRIY